VQKNGTKDDQSAQTLVITNQPNVKSDWSSNRFLKQNKNKAKLPVSRARDRQLTINQAQSYGYFQQN